MLFSKRLSTPRHTRLLSYPACTGTVISVIHLKLILTAELLLHIRRALDHLAQAVIHTE